MSLSTQTQFVRNFLCVAKSLIPNKGFLKQAIFPQAIQPFNEILTIELLIAVTQFAAVYFNLVAGIKDISAFFKDSPLFKRGLLFLERLSFDASKKGSLSRTLVRHGLETDRSNNIVKGIVGFWEIIFGLSFVFLGLNSVHYYLKGHPKPVIDALIAMEIGLAYVLVVMWRGLGRKFTHINILNKLSKVVSSDLSSQSFNVKNLLTQAADFGILFNFQEDVYSNINMLDVYRTLFPQFKPSYASSPATTQGEKIQSDLDHIEHTTSLNLPKEDLLNTLNKTKMQLVYESVFDIFYFILNFVAGYGYLLGILAFYFPYASSKTNNVDAIVKALMFQMSNDDADWWGNFAGDLAWTIEPVLVMTQGWIIKNLMKKQFSKAKKE